MCICSYRLTSHPVQSEKILWYELPCVKPLEGYQPYLLPTLVLLQMPIMQQILYIWLKGPSLSCQKKRGNWFRNNKFAKRGLNKSQQQKAIEHFCLESCYENHVFWSFTNSCNLKKRDRIWKDIPLDLYFSILSLMRITSFWQVRPPLLSNPFINNLIINRTFYDGSHLVLNCMRQWMTLYLSLFFFIKHSIQTWKKLGLM